MIAQTLKRARQEQGLTQQELADKLFVSRQTVSSWETGRNLPNLDTLAELASELQVTTDDLLGRTAKKPVTQHLTTVGYALATLICLRLTIATSAETLLLEDVAIFLTCVAMIWGHFHKQATAGFLRAIALLGSLMLATVLTNLFQTALTIQIGLLIAGAILLSETSYYLLSAHHTWRLNILKSKALWLTNTILFIIIAGLAVIVLTRRVDGTGVVETPKLRLIELAILGILVLLIILVELIIHLVNRAVAKRHQ